MRWGCGEGLFWGQILQRCKNAALAKRREILELSAVITTPTPPHPTPPRPRSYAAPLSNFSAALPSFPRAALHLLEAARSEFLHGFSLFSTKKKKKRSKI